jgi:hypothetical protein
VAAGALAAGPAIVNTTQAATTSVRTWDMAGGMLQAIRMASVSGPPARWTRF